MEQQFEQNKLWDLFLKTFGEEVKKGVDTSQIKENKKRTDYYENELIKRTFEKLKNEFNLNGKFIYQTEVINRIDYALIYKSEKLIWEVPVILIESENKIDFDSHYREVDKMCYLNAPLKLIFLHTNWPDMKYSTIDECWSKLIEAYIESIGIAGTLGVFVLDNSDNYSKYYYHKIVCNNKYLQTELVLENLTENGINEGIILIPQ